MVIKGVITMRFKNRKECSNVDEDVRFSPLRISSLIVKRHHN
jgi:hypothetical protein